MFVTKRKYKEMEKDRDFEKLWAEANIVLWLEESLDAAESALDYKEAVIEGLQDDIYRMHRHNQAVRDLLVESP